jgi:hypothetical protein
MYQDIRVAWRFLLKRRTATAVAVLTLGVAVAVCTIAFGLVDQAFWRPLAFDRQEALVTVYNRRPAAPGFQVLSYPDYSALRDRLRDGLDLAAFVRIEQTLGGPASDRRDDAPVRARGELVSDNYFDVLAAKPFAGELLKTGDARTSTAPVVILSHDLWRRRFASDPTVVGRPIRLGRDTYTVMGIAAPGFHGPAYPTDVWVPLAMSTSILGGDYLPRADVPLFQTVARLRDDVTAAQIDARVRGLTTYASGDGRQLTIFPADYLSSGQRTRLLHASGVFVLLAICVLLIATANLAALLIARADERRRARRPSGVGRVPGTLFRRLSAESLILSIAGGVPRARSRSGRPPSSARPVARAGAARVSIGCPARRHRGRSLADRFPLLFTSLSSIKRTSIEPAPGACRVCRNVGRKRPHPGALVVVQVALSCSLLILGGLLSPKSAVKVARVDIGFEPAAGVIGTVQLDDQGYSAATGTAFYDRLQDALIANPETEAATLGWHLPLAPIRVTSTFSLPGGSPAIQARYDVVSAGYFKTLRIAMRGGREFEARDTPTGEPVAVVNETMANRFTGDAIGQTIKLSNEKTPRRVVGVARDIKYNAITESSLPLRSPAAEAGVPDPICTSTSDAFPSRGGHHQERCSVARHERRRVTAFERSTIRWPTRSPCRGPRRSSPWRRAVAVFLALVGVYGVPRPPSSAADGELAIRSLWEQGRQRSFEG